MAPARSRVDQVVIDDDGLRVSRTDVGLWPHRNCRRCDGVRVQRCNAPLSRACKQYKVSEGHDMANRVGLTRSHPKANCIIVSGGQ